MDNYIRLIDDIVKTTSNNKFIAKQINKTKLTLNSNSAKSLESNANLIYWLYIYKYDALSLKLSEVLSVIPFDKDFDKWTWIESAISFQIYYIDNHTSLSYANLRSILNTVYDIKNNKISDRPLLRRLNGDLLFSNDIETAIKEKNIQAEIESRFLHFQELCFIYAFNDLPNVSKNKILTEINENLSIIRNLSMI